MGQLGMNVFAILMGVVACGVGIFCFISEHKDNKMAGDVKEDMTENKKNNNKKKVEEK